jgi:hypothetical protein
LNLFVKNSEDHASCYMAALEWSLSMMVSISILENGGIGVNRKKQSVR